MRRLDVLGPDLQVLFVGINPSLRSAEVGHNFARPGNRFYPALHAAGFTPRQLRPDEDGTLPAYGVGITNVVARPTRAADELSREELRAGARDLEELVATLRPRLVAILGLGAYQHAFARPKATMGPQSDTVGGGVGGIPLFILPNPSGLNAHYKPADFARLFAEVRLEAERMALRDGLAAAQVIGEDHVAVDEEPVEDGQQGAPGR